MAKWLLRTRVLLPGLAGWALLTQPGCLIADPDIRFQAFLIVLNEVGVFLLDNLLAGIR